MESINYDQLFDKMINSTSHMLILGPAGTGKSRLIKRFTEHFEKYGRIDELLLCAPTGIAAQNIGGRTIQSVFNIKPHTYNIYQTSFRDIKNKEQIQNAKILLIDEISMLRCDTLDIVNNKLRYYRDNFEQKFGGVRLIFLGDMFQLEPVTTYDEYYKMKKIYHFLGNTNYSFFNANAMMRGEYFTSTFDVYSLNHIFRQTDTDFISILNEIRHGGISDASLKILNQRFRKTIPIDENIQYLTITNNRSDIINNKFIELLNNKLHISKPEYKPKELGYLCNSFVCSNPHYQKLLHIKAGMKIMFMSNDCNNGSHPRYVNGSIGKITQIIVNEYYKPVVVYIQLENGNELEITMNGVSIYNNINGQDEEIGRVFNFPFRASYSITIDKSQGLTLNKIALILGRKTMRPNQLYVALSRARSLNDIIIDRPIERNDIRLSNEVHNFYQLIEHKIIPVEYNTDQSVNVLVQNCNNTMVKINYIAA